MRSENGLLTTIAASVEEQVQYALEEASLWLELLSSGFGMSCACLRQRLRVRNTAGQLRTRGGVYVVPAFTGLGAPYWDQYARGAVVGITRGTSKEHLIRATVESLAYQVWDLTAAMEQDSGIPLRGLKVDGGACANDFLMQFQADLLNTRVERPRCIETTAMGAAYLAGLAVGYWKNKEDVKQNWALERTFVPEMEEEYRRKLQKGWRRAVACSFEWAKEE